jgi:electron transfer flavoprotein beta subunit
MGRPILVAMKYVALRPEIHALTGAVATDERFSGASLADQAALEWALRIAERTVSDVIVVAVGGEESHAMLRDAIACGASRAIRISRDVGLPSSTVGAALAAVAADLAVGLVLCGDWSLDRGSGSVPPFIAAARDVGMACGLVALSFSEGGGTGGGSTNGTGAVLNVERRLDGGRRERLCVDPFGDAVLSVEGATARLRRATLAGVIAARNMDVEVIAKSPVPSEGASREAAVRHVRTAPLRPRARVLDGPPPTADPRQRVEALTGAFSDRTPPQRLELTPAEAADRILAQLVAWGELPA